MPSFKKEETEQDRLGSYVWVKAMKKLSSIIHSTDDMLVCMLRNVMV
jgi:hypothetical protein